MKNLCGVFFSVEQCAMSNKGCRNEVLLAITMTDALKRIAPMCYSAVTSNNEILKFAYLH